MKLLLQDCPGPVLCAAPRCGITQAGSSILRLSPQFNLIWEMKQWSWGTGSLSTALQHDTRSTSGDGGVWSFHHRRDHLVLFFTTRLMELHSRMFLDPWPLFLSLDLLCYLFSLTFSPLLSLLSLSPFLALFPYVPCFTSVSFPRLHKHRVSVDFVPLETHQCSKVDSRSPVSFFLQDTFSCRSLHKCCEQHSLTTMFREACYIQLAFSIYTGA